jgi:hypothetical protein
MIIILFYEFDKKNGHSVIFYKNVLINTLVQLTSVEARIECQLMINWCSIDIRNSSLYWGIRDFTQYLNTYKDSKDIFYYDFE